MLAVVRRLLAVLENTLGTRTPPRLPEATGNNAYPRLVNTSRHWLLKSTLHD